VLIQPRSIEPIYTCQLIDSQLREAMKMLFAPYVPLDDQVPSPRPSTTSDVPQPPPRPPHRPDEFKRSDSGLRSSQGPTTQVTTPTQTSNVPVNPVPLAPSGGTNAGSSPPAVRATTPQKPPLRKSGGPSAPVSQTSTPSPTPSSLTPATAIPAPLNITAAVNTNKDVTVTTPVKPQPPGPAAPAKQAPRNDASGDDWMAAWTSNIQKATREGGLVAPAANASPSPLTSPLLKRKLTARDDTQCY